MPSLSELPTFAFGYNRANYKYDQELRFERFVFGRQVAVAQARMFREDIKDLASVPLSKLKVYGPIYTFVIIVSTTTFVEGRLGSGMPGPPAFISGVYLQCLGIGISFMVLATYLLFNAALRAQVSAVQLRTRFVRLPAPSQRQLDASRRLLSTFEEQSLHDMFRVPFVMPNGSDPESREEVAKGKASNRGGKNVQASRGEARMPGFTSGHAEWHEQELQDRWDFPGDSPSACGIGGQEEPYKHFELFRAAQRSWWGCEAYMRICFLYGMMHLLLAVSYWLVVHCIAELGLVWCAITAQAGLTACVCVIFRLDVLPEHGGYLPVEIGGPFVAAVALSMMYAKTIDQYMIDISRALAFLILAMHFTLTLRLWAVARPHATKGVGIALESGGRLFNRSAGCDSPAWLPNAFQHVMYLVSPPKPHSRERARDNAKVEAAVEMGDMTPWHCVRTLLLATMVSWWVLIVGHAVECSQGERTLVSLPGAPPWSRVGTWYGWELGPVSSRHRTRTTPKHGHFAFRAPWGPNGQQEDWPSENFGGSPEADAWWAEDSGPEPRVGAAGIGENTWAIKTSLNSHGETPGDGEPTGAVAGGESETHAYDGSTSAAEQGGGHRRLLAVRAGVPIPVQWPSMLEPSILACAPASARAQVAAFMAHGHGAVLPVGATVDGEPIAAQAAAFSLNGLLKLGMARSVTWGPQNLTVLTSSGAIARCSAPGAQAPAVPCSPLPARPVPGAAHAAAAAAVELRGGGFSAAVAHFGGRVSLLKLEAGFEAEAEWNEVASINLPGGVEVVVVTGTEEHLLVVGSDAVAYKWALQASGLTEGPAVLESVAGDRRLRAACLLPGGRTVRLTSRWLRSRGGSSDLRHELLV